MKKYLLSIIAMFLMGFIAVGQVTIYEDNFDSYTAGEKCQIRNTWNMDNMEAMHQVVRKTL